MTRKVLAAALPLNEPNILSPVHDTSSGIAVATNAKALFVEEIPISEGRTG